jgi:putative restriction endonuclease
VGVTDSDWYSYLKSRSNNREVNFWRPYGGRPFKVLAPGEIFIFKTKYPQNKIVGGAIYQDFVSLNISRAWEILGEGNGVPSIDVLVDRLCAITGESFDDVGDREIGCVLLRDAWFLSDDELLPAPSSFSANIVQGKSYKYRGGDPVVDIIVPRILAHEESGQSAIKNLGNLGPTHGNPRTIIPRLGQAGFKAVVQEAYGRRCAITDHKIIPTLQAAHILPVAEGGEHRVDNGILLRSDVHTLFDKGYIGVDHDYRILVSPRLRSEFGNGDELYARQGHTIKLPIKSLYQPSRDYLSWHLETVFR